jgi:hypothetical protein
MAKSDDNVTLTREQFDALLASARAPAPAAPPGALDLDERMSAQMAAIRGTNRVPPPVASYSCRSRDTGATFTALLCRDVVQTLIDYVFPVGHDVHRKEGGLCPDGLPIKLPNGNPSPQFKRFCWQEIRKPDLVRHTGKPLEWLLRNADVLATPEEVAAQ